jgi:phenylpyruvate tautomerase PptA (4-oxalocrotonate tautomerase family)
MFEGELSDSQAEDLIHKVTEVVIPFVGEKLRDNTWVLIEERDLLLYQHCDR